MAQPGTRITIFAGRASARHVSLLITGLIVVLVFSAAIQADVSESRQQQLLYLLKQDCGSCHGMTLNGGLGPALLPEKLLEKPDEMLIFTILEGRPGTPMPPWKSELSHDDAAWLVKQLRSGAKEKENANERK